MEAGLVRRAREAFSNRFERVAVALLAVSGHRLSMELPRIAPVESLVRRAGRRAEGEDGSVASRLSPGLGLDEDICAGGRVDRLTVDLEGRFPVEHDVQLLLARTGLVMLADQPAVVAGHVGVDSECADAEVLAHGNVSVAPLDLIEARRFPVCVDAHQVPLARVAANGGSY